MHFNSLLNVEHFLQGACTWTQAVGNTLYDNIWQHERGIWRQIWHWWHGGLYMYKKKISKNDDAHSQSAAVMVYLLNMALEISSSIEAGANDSFKCFDFYFDT